LEGILRRLLRQLPPPLGSRTFQPPWHLILRDRQLLDRLILLLLLLFRLDLPRAGVRIDGVTTTGGDVAFLFLFFFFCSASFTAEIAAATAEVDFFATVDLVLRRV
jgi:hypothetical protein